MCAECDRFGRPANAWCRSVADTRSINEAVEKAQAAKAEEDKNTTE